MFEEYNGKNYTLFLSFWRLREDRWRREKREVVSVKVIICKPREVAQILGDFCPLTSHYLYLSIPHHFTLKIQLFAQKKNPLLTSQKDFYFSSNKFPSQISLLFPFPLSFPIPSSSKVLSFSIHT